MEKDKIEERENAEKEIQKRAAGLAKEFQERIAKIVKELKEEGGEVKVDKRSENYRNLLWDFLKHEDNLFTSRVNLFLLAESLLFISYFTSFTIEDMDICDMCHIGITLIIGILGVLSTIYYLLVFHWSITNISLQKRELKEVDVNFEEIKYNVMLPANANFIMGRILPFTFLFAWISLIIISLYCSC